MFARVYVPEDADIEGRTARRIIRLMYEYIDGSGDQSPRENGRGDRSVVDCVAGMADRHALRIAERIEPRVAGRFQRVNADRP